MMLATLALPRAVASKQYDSCNYFIFNSSLIGERRFSQTATDSSLHRLLFAGGNGVSSKRGRNQSQFPASKRQRAESF